MYKLDRHLVQRALSLGEAQLQQSTLFAFENHELASYARRIVQRDFEVHAQGCIESQTETGYWAIRTSRSLKRFTAVLAKQ